MKNTTRNYCFLFALLFVFSNALKAQNPNSLAFDGVDDQVIVPAASSLIANATGMTLSCWVYPTNASPTFPNFDGFAGFRNESDADFYLMQYSPSTAVEARFRNSTGTTFTIAYNGLVLNTWQHLTFTYDGSNLRLYKNGYVVDSLPANGSITNPAVDLYIGNLIYQSNSYLLTGKVDEVSLWSRALAPSEITCLPANGIAPGATDLQLYYKFNQGIAGGSNAAITTLTDETGTINGNLTNFALTGTTSNFVAGASAVTPIVAFVCPWAPYNFNGTNVYGPGTFNDTLTNVSGCDSIVQLSLSLLFVNTSVITSGSTMTASQGNSTYQWFDCSSGYTPIVGATSQSYTATANGSYAVSVVQSGCTDTSNCIVLTNVGIQENSTLGNITIYPSSMDEYLNVSMQQIKSTTTILINDISGKELIRINQVTENDTRIDVSALSTGVYFLKITSGNEEKVFKVFKN